MYRGYGESTMKHLRTTGKALPAKAQRAASDKYYECNKECWEVCESGNAWGCFICWATCLLRGGAQCECE